jgi:hypothetical protein
VRGVQISAARAGTVFRAKLGNETVAGVHRGPKWVPLDRAQADLGGAQDAPALLRYSCPRLR